MSTFVIPFPKACSLGELLLSLLTFSETPYVSCSPELQPLVDSWQTKVSFLISTLLNHPATVASFKLAGEIAETALNTLHINDGVGGIAFKLLTGEGIRIPKEGSEDYWSIIGLLDPRTDLLLRRRDVKFGEDRLSSLAARAIPGSKLIGDVCIMAAKLAYENPVVIKKVIREKWKMHVDDKDVIRQRLTILYFGAEHEPRNPTQVLMFSSKPNNPEDPPIVVVAFRGTMPFNTYDWSTDFEFGFHELPGVGKVHIGFLEALSLVDRTDKDTFASMISKVGQKDCPTSGLPEANDDLTKSQLAYDATKEKLKEFIKSNGDAKIYITGHSLGGALAVVFTGILFSDKEDLVTERIAAVYTFGQPRVGDLDFSYYMHKKLSSPNNRYFRVVFSNDLVPRVPFDNLDFMFKHFGLCFFFNSCYWEEALLEEPYKNFFSPSLFIQARVLAAWELAQSFLLSYRYGSEFHESLASTGFRLLGLLVPGIADHSPVNYVNSIRLGPPVLTPESLVGKLRDRVDQMFKFLKRHEYFELQKMRELAAIGNQISM